jgi:hypothetical protein
MFFKITGKVTLVENFEESKKVEKEMFTLGGNPREGRQQGCN